MKPKHIHSLIKEGEGPKIEFKREVHLSEAEGQVEFCKDVSSLANTLNEFGKDGYLLVGVEDSGEIIGLSSPLDDQKIQRVLEKYLQPRLQVSVSHVLLDGRLVGVIRIPRSYRKPHKIKKSYHNKKSIRVDTVFTRHLAQVVIASPEEIVALDQEASRERRRRYLWGVLGGVLVMLMLCVLSWWLLQIPGVQKQVYAVLPWERVPFVPDKIDSSALPLSRDEIEESLLGIGRASAYNIHYNLIGMREDAIFYDTEIRMTVSNYDYHLLKTGDISMGRKKEQYGIGDRQCSYVSGTNPEHWMCMPRKDPWNPNGLKDYPIDVVKMEGVRDVFSLLWGYYAESKGEDVRMYKIYRQGQVEGIVCDIYRSHFQIPASDDALIKVSLGASLMDVATGSNIIVREEGCMKDGVFVKYEGVMDFKDSKGFPCRVQVFYEAKVLESPPIIQLPQNILIDNYVP